MGCILTAGIEILREDEIEVTRGKNERFSAGESSQTHNLRVFTETVKCKEDCKGHAKEESTRRQLERK